MGDGGGEIYSATYSNVPVYELKVGGDHVMRRRSDDWINATHILKIAGFDKPARTRILEREVQKGVHEKIQGGYGKYQGTWVPLNDGRMLAEKNGILAKILNIFDYVAGDRTPPPAPKHHTANPSRPKQPKAPVQPRKMPNPSYYPPPVETYERMPPQYDIDSQLEEDVTPESASFVGDDNFFPESQNSTASRKRKRDADNAVFTSSEFEHTIYGDELLDYFVTTGDDQHTSNILPPEPPPSFDVNKPIDSHGNNALHWACSMGDVQVAKDLLTRGANPAQPNKGPCETPLIRAVLFTNNYDKQTFPKIVHLLSSTITERDRHGATVFHHIAMTARSRSKWSCARYYCELLISKMLEMGTNFVQAVLTSVDENLDTAVLCAVRNGCIKVASVLLNHCPEAGDIQNLKGETANEYLRILREKRESLEEPPSSPLRAGEVRSRKRSKRSHPQASSRAASMVIDRVGAAMEEASSKLAAMYDAEVKEKATTVAEAKQALADFEAQRSKTKQETFALMARTDEEGNIIALRQEYDTRLKETESLLEQKEHNAVQTEVLQQDQMNAPHAFRSANPQPLSQDEMRAALPWALELYVQQKRRRDMVKGIAILLGDAGASEKIGKHRRLVAIATGVKEEELDMMSGELLESLQATQAGLLSTQVEMDGPNTPPSLMLGLSAA